MKKQTLILGILLFLLNSSFAQYDHIAFSDDFNNNDNNWTVSETDELSSKISNGYYTIKYKKEGYSYRFWRSFNMQESHDYAFETKLKQIDGETNYGYGIVWNAYGWGNSYTFEIKSNGYYRISYYEDNKKTTWKDWTASSYINGLGKFNILKVEKKGLDYNFYINNKLVSTHPYKASFGSYQGFYVDGNITVSVDYMKITESAKKIEIENTIGGTKKENMGLTINSPYSEIAPIISPDGKTLYVARSKHPDNYGSDKSMYDIWYSEKQNDGTWTKLKNIGKPLNNSGDNLVIAISPDNNAMLVEGLYNYTGDYISDAGISISYRQQDRTWSIPQKVTIEDYYNLDEYESFCPSADRKVMLMSVKRDDSYGSKDLYVSFLENDGSYSKPKNMGNTINTYANEGTPFLATDGKTLYFYSYGHGGYGSADIFVTKRQDETWTNWSKPKNLGPLVNSFAWDTYFSISAEGDYAYLVSTKNSYGNEDIYRIKLDEEDKPEAVVLIYGKVYNKKTNKILGADISYEDLKLDKELGIARSNAGTGEYKIVLPYGKKYGIIAKKKGYMPVSENIDLTKISTYTELEMNLYLAPIEVGETIKMNNLFFDAGKAVLTNESLPELERLLDLMKDNPTMLIELQGHTNNLGSHNALVSLSEQRVNAVKKYLTDKGIKASRITGKGFGPDKPIASNNTQEGRQQNQRVEFKIIKK